MHSAIDIANFFIDITQSKEEGYLSDLKVNKLLYFAQAWSLVRLGRPLFDESIEAWPLGPVVPNVYNAFKKYKSNNITKVHGTYSPDIFSDEELQLLIDIQREYGKYAASTLVDMTHEKGSPWEQVRSHMHVESGWGKAKPARPETQAVPQRRAMAYRATLEEDAELLKIFERTYGAIRRRDVLPQMMLRSEDKREFLEALGPADDFLLVDGYNIIFGWEELNKLAKENLDLARTRLINIMCNYQGFRRCNLILVFDAYRVKGNHREIETEMGITVVYTKEAETADMYIEKTAHELGRNHRVRVATSDSVEQIIILGNGAIRVSAAEFLAEVTEVENTIRKIIEEKYN